MSSRHAHGCRQCRTRYEDACADTKANALCAGCRGTRVWQLLIDNASPHSCCLDSRIATKDECKSYSLAGSATWWICPACKRTQVYKPNPTHVLKESA